MVTGENSHSLLPLLYEKTFSFSSTFMVRSSHFSQKLFPEILLYAAYVKINKIYYPNSALFKTVYKIQCQKKFKNSQKYNIRYHQNIDKTLPHLTGLDFLTWRQSLILQNILNIIFTTKTRIICAVGPLFLINPKLWSCSAYTEFKMCQNHQRLCSYGWFKKCSVNALSKLYQNNSPAILSNSIIMKPYTCSTKFNLTVQICRIQFHCANYRNCYKINFLENNTRNT